MAASRADISGWFERGKEKGATHMIVVCDTFDHDDYPVYVTSDENVVEKINEKKHASMQRVMEVYSFALPKETQLLEHRAWHLETTPPPPPPAVLLSSAAVHRVMEPFDPMDVFREYHYFTANGTWRDDVPAFAEALSDFFQGSSGPVLAAITSVPAWLFDMSVAGNLSDDIAGYLGELEKIAEHDRWVESTDSASY